MKLWERVIERRLRKDISISENQFSFMHDRSTTEAIYLLRRLIGLYRDRKVDLHMVFIDLKKADDCLKNKGVSSMYIRVIKDMYEGGRMSARN